MWCWAIAFCRGAAKSLMWLATLCFQAQIVGLGRRQHLVSVEYVLLPLSHLFWQLGKHATVLVVSMFRELCLRIFLRQLL